MKHVSPEIGRDLLERMFEKNSGLSPEDFADLDDQVACENIDYLVEHGLAKRTRPQYVSDFWYFGAPMITPKGLDFIRPNMIGNTLNVLTVRLDDDTIRALLIDRVQDDPRLESSVKANLIAQIRSSPAEVLKTVLTEATKYGLRNAPELIRWVQNMPFHGPLS